MVNKERVQLLVDALRSGEFIQGKEYLSVQRYFEGPRKDHWLGVACIVALSHGARFHVDSFYKEGVGRITLYDGFYQELPPYVRFWYGFEECDPVVGNARASHLNDGLSMSFEQIARAFERKYLVDKK